MIKEHKCETCRHWRFIRAEGITLDPEDPAWPGPHGECTATDELSQDQGAWLYATAGPLSRLIDVSLITSPEWHCSGYAEKDA